MVYRAINLQLAKLACVAVVYAATPIEVRAEPISFPLADRSINSPNHGLNLTGHWLPAPTGGQRPTIIALHGCGGLYQRDGKTLNARFTEYVALFNQAGWHVLLPDSFTTRGQRSICAVANAKRDIRVETRHADVLAALQWLHTRSDVDPARIALVGWSHGAMTVLSSINTARPDPAQALAGAATFYPGCNALLGKPFKPTIPVLMQLGEKDDWTPPARCMALVEQTRLQYPEADIVVRIYPDSYHGFDGTQPVRFRSDVPNGIDQQGVHVGGNPAARSMARAELMKFLTKVLR